MEKKHDDYEREHLHCQLIINADRENEISNIMQFINEEENRLPAKIHVIDGTIKHSEKNEHKTKALPF